MEMIDLMSEILSNETIVSNLITDISKNLTPLKQNFNTDSQTTLLGGAHMDVKIRLNFMNKKLKYLSKNIKESLDIDKINKIAKDTKFIKRKGSITAKDFLMFNVFYQNNTLTNLECTLRTYFNKVIINDSTSFALPKEFKKKFPCSVGVVSTSSIKVQLQYELLTGSFMNIDIFSSIKNDVEYIKIMKKDRENTDLKLSDLGYFKIDYLKRLDKSWTCLTRKFV